MEFYISPTSGQFYMINVLENQWLSVTDSHGSPFLNFGHIITNNISELSIKLEYMRKNLNFYEKPIQ